MCAIMCMMTELEGRDSEHFAISTLIKLFVSEMKKVYAIASALPVLAREFVIHLIYIVNFFT